MTTHQAATAADIAGQLSFRQREVLQAAFAGECYRMEIGSRYTSHVEYRRRAVTDTVRSLTRRHLLRIGPEQEGWRRYWELTELGGEVLGRLAGTDGAR